MITNLLQANARTYKNGLKQRIAMQTSSPTTSKIGKCSKKYLNSSNCTVRHNDDYEAIRRLHLILIDILHGLYNASYTKREILTSEMKIDDEATYEACVETTNKLAITGAWICIIFIRYYFASVKKIMGRRNVSIKHYQYLLNNYN